MVFSSEFCSGNMTKAIRGYQKNMIDIYVACDATPHMDGDYYRTWFYFSVTGVPQGEQLTFTFKNLSNQVSNVAQPLVRVIYLNTVRDLAQIKSNQGYSF